MSDWASIAAIAGCVTMEFRDEFELCESAGFTQLSDALRVDTVRGVHRLQMLADFDVHVSGSRRDSSFRQ